MVCIVDTTKERHLECKITGKIAANLQVYINNDFNMRFHNKLLR